MRISDWSSDVCSSDLHRGVGLDEGGHVVDGGLPVHCEVARSELLGEPGAGHVDADDAAGAAVGQLLGDHLHHAVGLVDDHGPTVVVEAALMGDDVEAGLLGLLLGRSEEHTSELPSLMRSSYAVFCLKKKK